MSVTLDQVPAQLTVPQLGPLRICPPRRSPARLGQIVRSVAAEPARWRPVVRFTTGHRWYYRLDSGDPASGFEVWLLSWLPGQQTGFHDHGEACGAFTVAEGELQEVTGAPGRRLVRDRVLDRGAVRTFGPAHLHDVRNSSARPAVSVHAYSPPLTAMRRYQLTAAGLTLTSTDTAGEAW